MRTIWKQSMLTLLSVVLLVLAFVPLLAHAQSSDTANSMQIRPLRNDIEIEKGETKDVTVYVKNLSENTVTLRAITNDFVAGDDESGQPSIILDENEYAPTHSLKRFMHTIDDVTLKANEEKAVAVTITIPGSAESGGYFGAVRFVPTGGGDSQVNVAGSVTSLILLKVPGDYKESLELKEFSIRQDGAAKAYITSGDKLTVAARFENKGNVQVAPYGNITVQKGNKVVYSAAFNDDQPRAVVLPDSIRKWDIPLKDLEGFGKYTVILTASYGDSNQSINYERTIWLIPFTYILLGIVGVVVLLGVILAIILSIRSYKKKLLRQSRRR